MPVSRPRRIAVLVGSLRAASINRQLAVALARLAPADWTFEHLEIGDLPLYNQDHDQAMPAPAQRLKREIESADALLIVTPEYNRSFPGVLKNAIDTASRPYGKNSFKGKPAGLIGASVGAIGTATAQAHLRNVLAYLDVALLGQPEAYIQFKEGLVDAGGTVTEERVRTFLQQWVDAWVAFVEAHLADAAITPG